MEMARKSKVEIPIADDIGNVFLEAYGVPKMTDARWQEITDLLREESMTCSEYREIAEELFDYAEVLRASSSTQGSGKHGKV
jgi:hypothetical protein